MTRGDVNMTYITSY